MRLPEASMYTVVSYSLNNFDIPTSALNLPIYASGFIFVPYPLSVRVSEKSN